MTSMRLYYLQDRNLQSVIFIYCSPKQIGSFFMINLCLVVIATQFSETKKRETERMLAERKRFHSSSTLASLSEPGGCYGEILKYIAHIFRRVKRRTIRYARRIYRQNDTNNTEMIERKAITLRSRRRRQRGTDNTPEPSDVEASPRHPVVLLNDNDKEASDETSSDDDDKDTASEERSKNDGKFITSTNIMPINERLDENTLSLFSHFLLSPFLWLSLNSLLYTNICLSFILFSFSYVFSFQHYNSI